jgi:DnaJ-class molecular chaperone
LGRNSLPVLTLEDLARANERGTQTIHPDKHGGNKEAEKAFKRLKKA